MKRRTITTIRGLTAAALLAAATQAQAVVISLTPSDTVAQTGDTVSLDLTVSNVPLTGAIGDFDIDVAFDATRLALSSFSVTPYLGDFAAFEAIDFSLGDLGGGLVNLSVVSLLELANINALLALQPNGTFALGTLDFLVLDLSPGELTSVMVANVWAIGDEFGLALPVTGLNAATIQNPIAVPEPATWALMSLALAGLWLPRRRRTILD